MAVYMYVCEVIDCSTLAEQKIIFSFYFCSILCWGLNHSLTSNKPTHYLLDNDKFIKWHINNILPKIEMVFLKW